MTVEFLKWPVSQLRRLWRQGLQPSAETLVAELYAGLTDPQRAEICFAWDYCDEKRGLLRNFIANHWQVSRPCIRSDFFSAGQQVLIHDIFRSLIDPAWYPQFMRQLADDTKNHPWGQDQSVAIIGDPQTGPYQFLLTGRHLTLRCDGGTVPDTAFGGPIVYAHAATGYWEEPQHPGNIFWPQALAVSQFYDALSEPQRQQAVVAQLPEETKIGFDSKPQGICAAKFSASQKAAFAEILRTLMSPFRFEDRQRMIKCLNLQGGVDRLFLALSSEHRMSAPHWDIWRIQGPAFVWHYQGWPHVHAWVHIAARPDMDVNAHHGTFIFPEHDELR